MKGGDLERRRHERLSELLERQGARLFTGLNRLTYPHADAASELFQELFVRLGKSDGFAEASDADAFAWRTAINLAVQWRRERSRPRVESFNEQSFVAGSPVASPLDRLTDDDDVTRVLDSLHELSELTRECFVRRFVESESYEAIGVALGKTAQQARGLCHAAVRQLRAKLDPKPEMSKGRAVT